MSDLLSFIISLLSFIINSDKYEFSSIYDFSSIWKYISDCNDVMNHVLSCHFRVYLTDNRVPDICFDIHQLVT